MSVPETQPSAKVNFLELLHLDEPLLVEEERVEMLIRSQTADPVAADPTTTANEASTGMSAPSICFLILLALSSKPNV